MSTATGVTSSFHGQKNDSDELDVFEAAGYYSGNNELGSSSSLKGPSHWRTRRMSLDEHMKQPPSLFLPQGLAKQMKNKEQRQPRSPGGRLASFLNSLFNQSNSKKKSNKSGSSGSGSMMQPSGKEYEDPDQRRRRRSSISHFRSSSTTNESYSKSNIDGISNLYRSNYNNKSSSNVTTPIKSYKDFRSLSDHRKVDACNKPVASTADRMKKGSGLLGGNSRLLVKKSSGNEDKGSGMESYRKFTNNDGRGGSRESMLSDQEGEESDPSSDLFELQIGGGSYCSSDLPVYETTYREDQDRCSSHLIPSVLLRRHPVK